MENNMEEKEIVVNSIKIICGKFSWCDGKYVRTTFGDQEFMCIMEFSSEDSKDVIMLVDEDGRDYQHTVRRTQRMFFFPIIEEIVNKKVFLKGYNVIDRQNCIYSKYFKITRETINKYDDTECAICLDKFSEKNDIGILECGHIFHNNCLSKLIDTKPCPMCRQLSR